MKTKVNDRNDFALLLRECHLNGFAAEVGVAEGYFSFYLLDRWPGTCIQIDPWRVLEVPGYSLHGEEDQEARYQRILKRSKKYEGRSIPLRATSAEAVVGFSDGYFDFVYIDANHSYAAAKEDIALWWPKVKAGGILAGHDFLDGEFGGQEYGVKRAVIEFATPRRLHVANTLETDWPSWWILKP